ncbi:MAG TPA: sigma-70 family RNA polymerase sigma factor [Chloroflexota bacterium]|nr:sigma-70 family RNA polymerase sigma factor [Chloroflexota bacterium]
MTQADPQEIAQRAAQRDPDAFAQLYDEHADVVYRSIFYKVGDGSIAEDLTAEVFSKAWERIDRFQWRNVPVQHWLLRIARNVVIDFWRSRRRVASPIDELGEATSEDLLPDERIAFDFEVETLGRALRKLPDDQRDVLILRFIEGYSHKETAEVLKKSVVAVRQIQVRALRALQNLLAEGGTTRSAVAGPRPIRAIAGRDRTATEEAAP